MRKIVNLIREKMDDIEFDDIADFVCKSHDFADKIFNIDDKAKDYIKDKISTGIDKIKEEWNDFNLPDNAIDTIKDSGNYIDYQFGFSDKAKDIFDPFFSEDTSSLTMDYAQSVANHDISFTGVCNSSNINFDFGVIDSNIFDIFEASDGIDLATNISDGSEFLDTILDIGGEALEFSDAATTLGLSLVASWGVKKIFKHKHDEKAKKIEELSKKISLKMKLLSCIKNNVSIENAYPIYQSYIKK